MINILNKPTQSVENAIEWAKNHGAADLMMELAEIYWEDAQLKGVDPVLAYAQTALETNWLTFKDCLLDVSYKNTAGIKTTDGGGEYDPEAHYRFENWEDSVKAQIDHLALYAGQKGYPKKFPQTTTDPRHFSYLYGIAKTIEGMAGFYATDPSYGNSLIKLISDLQSFRSESSNLNVQKVIAKG